MTPIPGTLIEAEEVIRVYVEDGHDLRRLRQAFPHLTEKQLVDAVREWIGIPSISNTRPSSRSSDR